MRFCPECGTKVEGMKFCPECGMKLEVIEKTLEKNNVAPSHSLETQSEWEPPMQYYISRKKSYIVKDAQVELAKKLNIADSKEDIVIACGTYKPNRDCYLAFVTQCDACFVVTSKGEEHVFSYLYGDFTSDILDSNKLKLDTKETLGFKFSAINNELSMDIYKFYSVEFEIIRIISPEHAQNYFSKYLTSSFISQEKIDAALNIADAKLSETRKLEEYQREGTPYCPKCHSINLTAHKKGFGVGKAIVGAAATGGIGLVAGNINAKKVRLTCMNCGHQFWAGKHK